MKTEAKRKLILTFSALIVILITGTFGYWFLTGRENNLFLCFYMTVITITTIGFGEVIDMHNYYEARLFTVFLAFTGIGLLTYFVSTISVLIIEGEIRESFKRKKMEKEISKFENHYVICGVSRHSYHLIEELIDTNRESVFIEISRNVIDNTLEKYPDMNYLEGDATSDEVLLKAGIMNAGGLFVSTSDDNTNLVICLSARQLNPGIKIVSLCMNHNNSDKMKLAGANNVISPNYIGGLRMASEMLRPSVTNFLDTLQKYKNKKLRIEQIDLKDKFSDKKLIDLRLEDFKNTLVIALMKDDEWIFKPEDDIDIEADDVLIVMTTPEERVKLEQLTI